MNGRRAALLAPLCMALSGCGDGQQDLQAWLAEVKSAQKVSIEPLPVLKPYEPFIYQPDGLKDPFVDTLQDQQAQTAAAAAAGPRPDLDRRKEALEAYPLDALRMVGTLSRGGSVWALILAPDQTISRVGVGNYIGQNYGRVTRVEPDRVEMVELIPNGSGGWVERPASLAIVEQ